MKKKLKNSSCYRETLIKRIKRVLLKKQSFIWYFKVAECQIFENRLWLTTVGDEAAQAYYVRRVVL